MATNIECSVHIPGYTPDQVFEVGTRVETLPDQAEGFVLDIAGDRFVKGVAVGVGLAVAGRDFALQGRVDEFIEGERVAIRAKSKAIANVDVWLDLSEPEVGGTEIEYGIKIAHGLMTKAFEAPVRKLLEGSVTVFASDYSRNVVSILDQDRSLIKLAA